MVLETLLLDGRDRYKVLMLLVLAVLSAAVRTMGNVYSLEHILGKNSIRKTVLRTHSRAAVVHLNF